MDLKPTAMIESTENGTVVSIVFLDAGVDRTVSIGVIVDPKKPNLIIRLTKAIEAGVAFTDTQIKKNIYGKTYVAGNLQVIGRRLNADLKRLGY